MQYDSDKELMYYYSDGISISMNSFDELYVQHEGQWNWRPT